jgi:cyclopropane fatty-acyl-phospholipid synthase-like methyltransferase
MSDAQHPRTICRLCETSLSKPVLELENVPQRIQYFPTESELEMDKGASLRVFQCTACGLVQLNSPPVVYAEGATSTTGHSPRMLNYRRQQMKDFVNKYDLAGKTILDAGCGDGHVVGLLQEAGAIASGVDASDKAVKLARQAGLDVEQATIAPDVQLPGAPYDAFISLDVLEHVPDLKAFLRGVAANLHDGAVGLIETHTINKTLEEYRFYDFVLDHLSYFTLQTFSLSLELSGFDVLHIERNRDGENLTALVRKRTNDDFTLLNQHIETLRQRLAEFIAHHQTNGKQVAIWGASFQTLTLSALVPLDGIAYVIDSAPYKQGRYTPVSHLPIVSPSRLEAEPVNAIIVIASRYNQEIVQQLREKELFQGTIATLNGIDLAIIQNTHL